jgi:hypothetical protein
MTRLAGPIFDGTANVNNIATVGGSSHVTAVGAPHVVTMGVPVVADVALAVPMMPKLRDFVVGAKVSAWVEHSFLYVGEETKMSPPIRVTVKAEQ